MKLNLKKPAIGAAALAALFLTVTSAHAVDLRSWDQKINDATRRFVVLPAFNNEAVLDKETQLVWQRTPSNQNRTADNALEICGRTPIGGRTGWRLPTASEIMSLIDPSVTNQYTPALPAGHPFINVRNMFQGNYWTTTPRLYDPSYKMAIGMVGTLNNGSGAWSSHRSTAGGTYAAAWCVRGPTSAGL